MDKAYVASAQACPKSAPTVVDAVELKVKVTRRTAASIGKPEEEDLYEFVVSTGSNHVIDTKGRPTW